MTENATAFVYRATLRETVPIYVHPLTRILWKNCSRFSRKCHGCYKFLADGRLEVLFARDIIPCADGARQMNFSSLWKQSRFVIPFVGIRERSTLKSAAKIRSALRFASVRQRSFQLIPPYYGATEGVTRIGLAETGTGVTHTRP
jgi:hypothetical protein